MVVLWVGVRQGSQVNALGKAGGEAVGRKADRRTLPVPGASLVALLTHQPFRLWTLSSLAPAVK